MNIISVSIPELEQRWGLPRTEWDIPAKYIDDAAAPVQFRYDRSRGGYLLFAMQNDGLYYQVSNAVFDEELNFLSAV